jgi:5-methylcytosine-specific restriction protein B
LEAKRMAEQFKWVSFYMEFATKLLEYKADRVSLIEKLQNVYSGTGMKLPKLEKDNVPKDIDPFTTFGLFNKGITDAKRISILGGIKSLFGIEADFPDDFSGIPVLNNILNFALFSK